MKSSKKIFVGIIGFLLILLLGFLAYYYLVLSKPKNIFSYIIDTGYNKVNETLNKSPLIKINDQMSLESNISIKTNEDISFTNYTYQLNAGRNLSTEQLYVNLAAKENNKNVLSGNILLNKADAYVKLPELFSKSIYLGNINDVWTEIKDVKSVTNVDLSYAIGFIKNSFLKNINDSDFSTSNEEITVNDSKMKAKKITLTLSAKRVKEISKNVVNDITNDKRTKTVLAKLAQKDEEKLIEDLNKDVESIDIEEKGSIKLNFYTKSLSNKLIKFTLKNNDDKEVIVIDTYNNKTNIKIISEDESSINIDIQNNNGKYVIKYSKDDIEYATININEITDLSFKGNITIKDTSNNNAINVDISYTAMKNDENNVTTNFVLNLNDLENTSDKITISAETKIKNTFEPQPIPNTTAVSIELLTEADMNEIYTNLMQNEFILDIMAEYYKINASSHSNIITSTNNYEIYS